jgi:class 3 adenylate cyclase
LVERGLGVMAGQVDLGRPGPVEVDRETPMLWSRKPAADIDPVTESHTLQRVAPTLDQLTLLVGTGGRQADGMTTVCRRQALPVARDIAPDAAVAMVVVCDGETITTAHPGGSWLRLTYDDLVREQLAAHGCAEVAAGGEFFAASFPSPRRAVLCAIGLQRALAGHAAEHPEQPIRARIALHIGGHVPEDADRFRRAGTLAARIAARARGGEILVSAALRELAGTTDDLRFGPARAVEIDGFRSSCTVHEVCWATEVAAPEPVGGVFRRDGEHWRIAWRGRHCLVRDVRGLHYIAHLLCHPGREFHALDLIGANGVAWMGAQRTDGLAMLDPSAKAAYRQRLDDLRDDLEEAERLCDVGRAGRARAEREALAEELAAAVGLGGRDRLAAAAAERARSTVAQAIRLALKRIRSGLPMLADELGLRIKTGVYCVYLPDSAHPTDWAL